MFTVRFHHLKTDLYLWVNGANRLLFFRFNFTLWPIRFSVNQQIDVNCFISECQHAGCLHATNAVFIPINDYLTIFFGTFTTNLCLEMNVFFNIVSSVNWTRTHIHTLEQKERKHKKTKQNNCLIDIHPYDWNRLMRLIKCI